VVPKVTVLVLVVVVVIDTEAPGLTEPPVAVEDRASLVLVALVNSPLAQAVTWMGSETRVFPKQQGEREQGEVESARRSLRLRTDRDSWSWRQT
jgi:hypothetical protein